MQAKIDKLIELRDEGDLDEDENDIKVSIELLKEDLLDIEVRMQDALRDAYGKFM
jgi:hypothetical protein